MRALTSPQSLRRLILRPSSPDAPQSSLRDDSSPMGRSRSASRRAARHEPPQARRRTRSKPRARRCSIIWPSCESRLMMSVIAIVVAFVDLLHFRDPIFMFLTEPFQMAMRKVDPERAGEAIQLINTGAFGFFSVKMQIALFGGDRAWRSRSSPGRPTRSSRRGFTARARRGGAVHGRRAGHVSARRGVCVLRRHAVRAGVRA